MLTRSCISFDSPFSPLSFRPRTPLARLYLIMCDFHLIVLEAKVHPEGTCVVLKCLGFCITIKQCECTILQYRKVATSADPKSSLETGGLNLSNTSVSRSRSFLVKVLTLTLHTCLGWESSLLWSSTTFKIKFGACPQHFQSSRSKRQEFLYILSKTISGFHSYPLIAQPFSKLPSLSLSTSDGLIGSFTWPFDWGRKILSLFYRWFWGRSSGEGNGYPPVFLPTKFQEKRCPVGYSPCGPKELDSTEWLTLSLLHFHMICRYNPRENSTTAPGRALKNCRGRKSTVHFFSGRRDDTVYKSMPFMNFSQWFDWMVETSKVHD